MGDSNNCKLRPDVHKLNFGICRLRPQIFASGLDIYTKLVKLSFEVLEIVTLSKVKNRVKIDVWCLLNFLHV